MLYDLGLIRFLWAELLRIKVYLKNRSLITRLKGITSYET